MSSETDRLVVGAVAVPAHPSLLARTYRGLRDPVIGTLVILLLWQLASSLANDPLFPGVGPVARSLVGMAATQSYWSDVWASVDRILVGYALGLLIGIAGGIVLGLSGIAYRLFTPLVNFVRMIPPVALVPVAIIWFGIGQNSKYFIVLYTVATTLLITTVDAINRVPRTRLLAARCLGASPLHVIKDVILPSSVPHIWTGMRISTGFAVASVVAAELIAASNGIGQLITSAGELLEVKQMFVGLVTLAVLGLVLDRVVHAIGRRLLRHYLLVPK